MRSKIGGIPFTSWTQICVAFWVMTYCDVASVAGHPVAVMPVALFPVIGYDVVQLAPVPVMIQRDDGLVTEKTFGVQLFEVSTMLPAPEAPLQNPPSSGIASISASQPWRTRPASRCWPIRVKRPMLVAGPPSPPLLKPTKTLCPEDQSNAPAGAASVRALPD